MDAHCLRSKNKIRVIYVTTLSITSRNKHIMMGEMGDNILIENNRTIVSRNNSYCSWPPNGSGFQNIVANRGFPQSSPTTRNPVLLEGLKECLNWEGI